jgi:hypothetical protein
VVPFQINNGPVDYGQSSPKHISLILDRLLKDEEGISPKGVNDRRQKVALPLCSKKKKETDFSDFGDEGTGPLTRFHYKSN